MRLRIAQSATCRRLWQCPRSGRRPQGGAVLVIVMLMLIGLLGMGITGVFLTSGNLQMATNTNLRNQALYVAEAGVERARAILVDMGAADYSSILGGPGHASHPADEIPVSLDSKGQPAGRGAIMRDTAGVPLYRVVFPPASVVRTEPIPDDNPNGATNATMGTYTVYLRNDTAECRMGRFTVDGSNTGGNQALLVRSEGTAFDGRTTVVLEVVMGPPPIPAPPPPKFHAQILCNSGKNACDDNSSVQNNVVVF